MRVPARPRLRRNRGRDGPRGRPRNFLKCVRSRTTPARSASPPHAPRLRDVLRVFVLRRRLPAPSLRCGSIGNELRAPRRLRAPRPTQAPSRRWPARPGGDSRRLLSTPVDYPSMREGRRLDALRSLQAHRQARSRHRNWRGDTPLTSTAIFRIIYMPVQAGAHSAEGGRAPPPHAACWNTRRFLCSL